MIERTVSIFSEDREARKSQWASKNSVFQKLSALGYCEPEIRDETIDPNFELPPKGSRYVELTYHPLARGMKPVLALKFNASQELPLHYSQYPLLSGIASYSALSEIASSFSKGDVEYEKSRLVNTPSGLVSVIGFHRNGKGKDISLGNLPPTKPQQRLMEKFGRKRDRRNLLPSKKSRGKNISLLRRNPITSFELEDLSFQASKTNLSKFLINMSSIAIAAQDKILGDFIDVLFSEERNPFLRSWMENETSMLIYDSRDLPQDVVDEIDAVRFAIAKESEELEKLASNLDCRYDLIVEVIPVYGRVPGKVSLTYKVTQYSSKMDRLTRFLTRDQLEDLFEGKNPTIEEEAPSDFPFLYSKGISLRTRTWN